MSFLFVLTGKVDLLREGIKILDPLIEDDAGNTLLHLLAMGSASPAKIRSLEIVTEFPLINPNIKNKQGKRAIDNIVRKDDIRRKMLAVSEKAPVTAAANSNDATKSSKKKKRKRKRKEKVKENCETAERPLDSEEDEAEDYLQQSAGKSETESLRQKIPSPYEETKESVKRHVCEFDISKIVENQTFPGKLDVTKTNSNIQNGGTCNDEKTTENHDTQQSVNEDEGKVKEELEVNPDDEMLVSDKDEIEDELEENDFDDLEGNIFEGLAWEVECTAEVWKTLRERRLQPYLKKKIINKIRMLATGDWRPELAIRLEGISRDKNIRLYEAKLTKGARILWEEAIAFSPRCSMDPEIRLRLGKKEGRIYTDIIRIWDIALNHSAVPHTIDRVVKSHDRGLTCDIQKKLKGLKQDAMEIQQDRERIPNIYVDVEEERKLSEVEAVNEMCKKDIKKWQELFFPPASPNDREYHILKFYAFTSAMANSILHVTDHTFDFPFQVSELEHAVINLDPEMQCALLLLGRSGTGKTTCCLYRLWRRFQVYWQSAITAGPYIPRLPVVRWAGDVQNDEESDLVDREGKASDDDTITSHRPVLLSCGCTDVCECVLATFRAMSGDEDRTMNENQDLQFTNEHEKNNAKEITPEFDIIESQDDSKEDEKQFEHLRQIFVTKNAVLCHEVKKNFQELSHASPEAKQHVETEDEPMPNKLDNTDAAFFPLFLSSKELLLLLDASLPGETFFPRDDEGNLLVSVPGWGENDNHLSFLPTLESDVEEFESEDEYDAGTETESKPPEGTMREITYNVFVLEIWARMLRKQDISYHPSLVWTEIRSFIKGSVEALLTTSGYLSLEEYLDLGRKRAPNFTANRKTIYEIFLIYQKIKVQRGLFDEADVLFHVYQRIRNVVLPNWAFHEVYVDETQDFTQAELFTLIRCCRNPNTMFFTGDTAQSIMRGVSFRFSDLKTLFYSTKQALKSVNIMEKIGIPRRVYQLTHNYRSHKGILDLAASVIDILGHFFPESFDQLKRDVGLFPGPKPVILETSNFSDLAVLLKGSQRKTSVIEFGAHQVVLVSTEESKHTLPEELRYALVLSIYEAKGLEFDDVLLYNFFKDSQVC